MRAPLGSCSFVPALDVPYVLVLFPIDHHFSITYTYIKVAHFHPEDGGIRHFREIAKYLIFPKVLKPRKLQS
jgi:hypothetical protein